MEPVFFNAQPDKKAITISKSMILFFSLFCLEIGGAYIYATFITQTIMPPLFFIGIQRVAGIALILGCIYPWGYDLSYLGLSPAYFKHGIKHGLFWCLGFGLLIGLVGIALLAFRLNPRHILGNTKFPTLSNLIIYILVGCLLGPMVEDLVFIGLLYNSFRKKFNLIFSVLIVVILFAIAHGFISISLIIQVIGAFLFTLSFEFSGSLLTPIIIHICGNTAILIIQLL